MNDRVNGDGTNQRDVYSEHNPGDSLNSQGMTPRQAVNRLVDEGFHSPHSGQPEYYTAYRSTSEYQ